VSTGLGTGRPAVSLARLPALAYTEHMIESELWTYLDDDKLVHYGEPGAARYLCGAANVRPNEPLRSPGTVRHRGCDDCLRSEG
jgi:hypothetical protein